MEDILEIIQTISRTRGRGSDGPLLVVRALPGAAGERPTHLPIDSDLAQAWTAFVGEPFHQHQSQAVAALRRGEPVALLANNPRVGTTAYLLMYAALAQERSSAVLLAPDMPSAYAAGERISYINENMPALYRLTPFVLEPNKRPDPHARIIITTAGGFHSRLLRHHDRAWSLLWANTSLLAINDIHRYHGVAGAHLGDMLLRAQRIVAAHRGGALPHLLATGWELENPLPALENIYGAPWKVVLGDDLPYESSALGVWRGGGDRLRESVDLARALLKQGYHVHIQCQPIEQVVIGPILGDTEGLTSGPVPQAAHVLVCAGYPGSQSALRRFTRSGYSAVIVVVGDSPHEQMLLRHTETLFTQGPSAWPAPPRNAYVTAQHILCAASELPLTEAEVEAAGVRDIVDRLVENDQLIDLPDPEVAWKPGPASDDPYLEFSLLSASGGAAVARNEQGRQIDLLDPSSFERWHYLNAALPPMRGGLRVISFEEEHSLLNIRIEGNGRRSIPLRRLTLAPRGEKETRKLFLSSMIGFGRSLVEEEIVGSREAAPQSAPTELTLRPPLQSRWIAACCWFEIASAPQVNGQLIGWSLAAALELRTLAKLQDIVPCYVPDQKRLYFVDSQPGGNGLAAWLYAHAEDLLPIAYDIALACRNDPLLEPIARADMDWLLPLLGKRESPKPVEIPAKPAEAPKLVFVPVPEEPIQREGERRAGDKETRRQGDKETSRQPPASRPNNPRNETAEQQRLELPPVPPRGQGSAVRSQAPGDKETRRQGDKETSRRGEGEKDTQGQRGKPQSSALSPQPAPANSEQRTTDNGQPTPDANALIERLRRQREQREAQNVRAEPQPRGDSASTSNLVLRFKAGDRIFALPYGDGVVRESRAEDERELLSVEFPEYGELTIDPALSLVRKIEEAPEEDDLL